MADGADKRAYVRIEVNYHATVRAHGTETAVEAKVLDLSGNGIRLWLPVALESADALTIMLHAGNSDAKPVVVAAEVVRVTRASDGNEPGCEVACTFD